MASKDKVNILLVDDQPGKLLSYEVILSDLNENLLKAASANEALQHLLKNDVAVVLVDVCMPELDGFELAEVDLELRGEGTILGTRQKGRSDLKLASLRRDKDLVQLAREVAFEMVDRDPTLSSVRLLREEVEELVDPEEREFLFKS